MNMFIYTENGDLHIRKPNGLEYQFQNTDKPNLGFEYDVVVYDQEEFKITKWEEGVDFNDQVKSKLNDVEIDAIEQYIDNSEAPPGVTLTNMYSSRLNERVHQNIGAICDSYGFGCITDVLAAGREGSNHPLRSDARRVLEYHDAVWNVYISVIDEIQNTREDVLKDYYHYKSMLPQPLGIPNA